MKRLGLILSLLTVLTLSSCLMDSTPNPFFEAYNTPHGTVPFDQIKTEHYMPAVQEGIRRQNEEIEAIINNPEAPTFANTVLAYEQSGEMLNRVSAVFGNLLSAETNDEMQVLAQEIMPLMSEHSNNISLNEKLFARIKAVYEQREQESLNAEQLKLLEDIYTGFTRNGANLEGEAKEKYRALRKELSLLTLQFSDNALKETNDYQLVITDTAQLAGLPESAVEAAAETAQEKGVEGWVFTLQAPSYSPFLTYADNRDLRQQIYLAYNTKCTHDNAYNNLEIVKKLANTRMAIAQVLGYDNYAEYALQERMAQNSDAVYKLLNHLSGVPMPAPPTRVCGGAGIGTPDRGRRLCGNAVGLELLLPQVERPEIQYRRRDAAPLLRTEQGEERSIRACHQTIWHHLQEESCHSRLSQRCGRLRSVRQGRAIPCRTLHGLPPPRGQTCRCLDDRIQRSMDRPENR